jgi:hypothetical protein
MSAGLIIRETAAVHGVSVADIRSRSHAPELVAARIEIARRLSARGMTTGQIGIRIGRSGWTVRYYLDADFRERRIARSLSRWHLLHAKRKNKQREWCRAFQPREATA